MGAGPAAIRGDSNSVHAVMCICHVCICMCVYVYVRIHSSSLVWRIS